MDWPKWCLSQIPAEIADGAIAYHRHVTKKGRDAHLFKVKAGKKTYRYAAIIGEDGTPAGVLEITSTQRKRIGASGRIDGPLPSRTRVSDTVHRRRRSAE